ncbi:lantibiotic dehydratase [Bacillus firmus]|uniref:lantibiotic dehydratase n=1 Tax=Cytobacillus firmus TaxID=1399 RepID=UPI0015805FE0|nr:lantibiotic dehydratase [Cytobacillus firmus]NUH83966.1 lantibiotic dehydratase [Cytobacillus firmus]
MIVKERNKIKKNNKKEEPLYSLLDYFMLRSPLMPFQVYSEMSSLEGEQAEEQLFQLMKNREIREAIYVSSPSLYHSLIKLEKFSDSPKKNQLIKSALKYLIRMSTRPTPFGLCSGVEAGRIGDKTDIVIPDNGQFKKRARPDMEWLLKAISILEEEDEVLLRLQVMRNHSLYYNGTRVKLLFHTGFGQLFKDGDNYNKQPTIRFTQVVEDVFRLADKPIAFSVLVHTIKERYPQADTDTITQFIKELLKQEFLISEIRPSLMDVNPLSNLINKIIKNQIDHPILSDLQNVETLFNEYNLTTVGQGEEIFTDLKNSMKKVTDAENLIQVDLAMNTRALTLSETVKDTVELAAETLWKLSPPHSGFEHIDRYREDFVERYGTYQEVPLLTLLDEDMGLGYPATYEFPPSSRTMKKTRDKFTPYRTKVLLELMTRAIKDGSMEIKLTDQDIERLSGKEQMEQFDPASQAPISMELYFQILAKHESDIDDGNYEMIIGGNPGSAAAGKTFGRFIDILDDSIETKLADTSKTEQSLYKDSIFAELVYLPPAGRAANLMVSKNTREYEIAVGTNSSKPAEKQIPLEDIVVGCNLESFYLKSKRLNKRIIPVTCHMLDYSNAPNVCRFLREVALEGVRHWMPFDWGELEHSYALPGIRYKNILLSPAEWKVDPLTLDLDQKISGKEFMDYFKKWRKERKIPRYVYQTRSDNRVLLDLENSFHLELLEYDFKRLSKGQTIRITETGMKDPANLLVKNNNGDSFFAEFVFPLVKNNHITSENKLNQNKMQLKKEFIPGGQRLKFPGSEWLYIKLYGMNQRVEEFLYNGFCKLAEEAKENGWADQAFFIRYIDEVPHIRIRLKGDPDLLVAKGIPSIYQWANTMKKEGLLNRMVIDTYDPEIERYGGSDLISSAETFFSKDSEAVARYLGLRRFERIDISEELFGALNVIDILEGFSLSFIEQLNWLNDSVNYKEYKEEFKQMKSELLRYGNTDDNWANLQKDEKGQTLYSLMNIRKEALSIYADKVNEANRQGLLANHIDDLIGSVIHMHINRLIGVDRTRETKIITLARHTLYHLRYQKEKQNNG